MTNWSQLSNVTQSEVEVQRLNVTEMTCDDSRCSWFLISSWAWQRYQLSIPSKRCENFTECQNRLYQSGFSYVCRALPSANIWRDQFCMQKSELWNLTKVVETAFSTNIYFSTMLGLKTFCFIFKYTYVCVKKCNSLRIQGFSQILK